MTEGMSSQKMTNHLSLNYYIACTCGTTEFSQKKDDSPYERGHEMIEALGTPTNYYKTTHSFELLGSFVGMSE